MPCTYIQLAEYERVTGVLTQPAQTLLTDQGQQTGRLGRCYYGNSIAATGAGCRGNCAGGHSRHGYRNVLLEWGVGGQRCLDRGVGQERSQAEILEQEVEVG